MEDAILCSACRKVFAVGVLDDFPQSDSQVCLWASPGPVFCARHRKVLHSDLASYCRAIEQHCYVCSRFQALEVTSSAVHPFPIYYHLVGWRDDPYAPQGLLCVLSVYIPEKPELYLNINIEPSPGEAMDATIMAQARRSPAAKTTSDPCVLDLARTWLDQCVSSHSSCQVLTERLMPRRILYLSQSQAKLIECSELEGFPYATLSHCWGLQPFFTLSSESHGSLCHGLPIDSFKPTFRDAMRLVQQLGIKYLWIDSYCIFQGSSPIALQDWKEHSTSMQEIYAHAVSNVGATHGTSPDDGLFVSSNGLRRPIEVDRRFVNEPGRRWVVTETRCWQPFSDQPRQLMRLIAMLVGIELGPTLIPPLLTRGWVVQERVLARRMLHFTAGGIVWECAALHQANEWEPWGTKKTYQPDISPGAVLSLGLSTTDRRYANTWATVLQTYTRTSLTYPEKDKLMAIEGIGRRLAALGKDTYSLGFLHSTLPRAICWGVDRSKRVNNAASLLVHGTRAYQAPSWHWAARTGGRTFNVLYEDAEEEERRRSPLVKVLAVQGLYSTALQAFTPLFCVGRLIPIWLMQDPQSNYPYIIWKAYHDSFETDLYWTPFLSYDVPLTEQEVDLNSKDIFAAPVWYEVQGGLRVEGAPLRRLLSHCRAIRTGTASDHVTIDGLFDTRGTECGADPRLNHSPNEYTFKAGGLVLQRTSPSTYKRIGKYEVQQPLPSAHHVFAMMMARAQLICIV